jgi:hypothetical protein
MRPRFVCLGGEQPRDARIGTTVTGPIMPGARSGDWQGGCQARSWLVDTVGDDDARLRARDRVPAEHGRR